MAGLQFDTPVKAWRVMSPSTRVVCMRDLPDGDGDDHGLRVDSTLNTQRKLKKFRRFAKF